jgi:dihydroneopterin aldolase
MARETNMDIVYITGLNAETTIGTYDHERNIKQTLVIDLELGCHIREAGRTDNFELALDYDAISKRVVAFIASSDYYLIEAVAENLVMLLFEEFSMDWIRLRVSKPGAVSNAKDVGVLIERERFS